MLFFGLVNHALWCCASQFLGFGRVLWACTGLQLEFSNWNQRKWPKQLCLEWCRWQYLCRWWKLWKLAWKLKRWPVWHFHHAVGPSRVPSVDLPEGRFRFGIREFLLLWMLRAAVSDRSHVQRAGWQLKRWQCRHLCHENQWCCLMAMDLPNRKLQQWCCACSAGGCVWQCYPGRGDHGRIGWLF